jgi:membrane protease subunit HflK
VAIAVWMLTGFYVIQPGYEGVVQRFGKHVETVGDGWGWRLPWPVEKVTKVDVQGVQSTSYKARVLTAEPNMVELQVAVQYRVKNAEDNLFRVREPIATLGEVSESAIREVVGRNDQQAILEAGRVKIAEDTRVIMQRTLDQYGAGIEVRSVNITDVQVPEAVQQAQRDSVRAKADRERMIKDAQAIANGIIPQAQGRAAREVQEAEAYKSQIEQIATGEVSRFNQLSAAYDRAPGVTRERMYIETMENVLSRTRKVVIDSKAANGNMIYLPLDKLLDRREGDSTTGSMRPSVTVESEPASTDARQRVER